MQTLLLVMYKGKRKVILLGQSKAITIPKGFDVGEEVSIVIDGNLMLVDLTGDTKEDDLASLLEEVTK